MKMRGNKLKINVNINNGGTDDSFVTAKVF